MPLMSAPRLLAACLCAQQAFMASAASRASAGAEHLSADRQPESSDLRKVSLTAEGAVVHEALAAAAPAAKQSLVRREAKALTPGLGDAARLDAARVAALTTMLFPEDGPVAAGGPEMGISLVEEATSSGNRQPTFPSPGEAETADGGDRQSAFPSPNEDPMLRPEDRPDPRFAPEDPLGDLPPMMETPPRPHEWGRTDLLDPEMTALDNATVEAAAEAALEEEEIERNVVRGVQEPAERSSVFAVAAVAISVPLCLCVVFSVSGLGFPKKERALSSHGPGSPAEGGYAADASGEEAADDAGADSR